MRVDGVETVVRERGSGDLCRTLLARLPQWFGIPESNARYAELADGAPSVVALVEGREVGLLVLTRHAPHAAEVELMAVSPEQHRRGIGTALIGRAEEVLADDGVLFLQVKTLSATVDYEPYERTRAFYRACGFEVLQELPDLWGPENPALQMIRYIGTPPHDG